MSSVRSMGRLPPGPTGLPIVGSTFDAFRDPYGFFMRAWKEHGDVVRLRFGPFEYFLINDPDAIKYVLVDNAKNYPKSRTYDAFKPLLGEGLLTSEGEPWRRQRRLVQPAFHRECLTSFADSMAHETARMLASWRDGEELDIHREMGELTFRIVGRTLFNADVEGDGEAVARALKVAMKFIDHHATSMVQIPTWIPTPRNVRFLRVKKTLDGVVQRIMDERVKSGGAPRDVISLLMAARDEETGGSMSREQLRDEVMTLALAGYETTSNALTWSFLLLSRNPSVEQRLHREITEMLGDRLPTFEDLPRLKYAQMVIQETMRLYPPAWKIERQAIAGDRLCGYDVAPGTIIGITMHTLHRHAGHWENPEGFDPERFTSERSERRARYAYLPFGGGARVCIGNAFAMMEAQIILAMIVRRYRVDLAPGFEPTIEPAVTLHPRDGIPVKLRARSRATDEHSIAAP